MIRTFGLQTLNGNSQPLFGDKITAAFVNVKNSQGYYIMVVADTTKYRVGDRIIVGYASGSPTNCVMVVQIKDATTLYVMSEGDAPLAAWNTNTQIYLSFSCAMITVQSQIGNAGNVYLGADSTVTNAGGGSAFFEITVGGEKNYGQGQWNSLMTSEVSMAGQNGDKVGVSALVV